MKNKLGLWIALPLAAALALAACGGGSGGTTTATGTAAPTALSSSGTIDAFGSVFVNGHEFAIGAAKILDDDAPASMLDASALEVGMSVDVVAAADSTSTSPAAAEIHLHPLARGVVDALDTNASTLTVMAQTVQLTAGTNFSDHRACLTATTSPCTAVAGQSDLTATTGSVAGNYVTVYGYLHSTGTAGGTSSIVATLIVVNDPPTSPGPLAYKAEGLITAASGTTASIGGLALDLSVATCYAKGAATACAGAYAIGQVVSAVGATAPALPASSFQPAYVRLRSKLPVQTDGAPVEIEGRVSSVSASPASFAIRGIMVDATALSSGSLPAAGDIVRVAGVVAAGGTSIAASSVTVIHATLSATYGFEGDAGGVVAGSSANTWVLTLLGQSIAVGANTRLADRSQHGNPSGPTTNPFNITTFQTYLAASASQHLLVTAQADDSGKLSAMSLTIVPEPSVAGIAGIGGIVDATPAPVNGGAGGTTAFSVHGLAVSADTGAVIGGAFPLLARLSWSRGISAGDLLLVRGSYAGGTITVTAPPSATSVVIDKGAPQRGNDYDGF